MQLERTGPFVPPIFFPTPAEIVVTSSFQENLRQSGLSGLSYRRIDVATAVVLRWELWDRSARMPSVLPQSGEPEDYLPIGKRDAGCAENIGQLWEIEAPVSGIGRKMTVGFREYRYVAELEPNAPDFCRVAGFGFVLVSDRARAWLSDAAPDWISFEEL